MTQVILEKFSELQTKKKNLISLYHHSQNPQKFNYTTPKEKNDYEYLHTNNSSRKSRIFN